MKRRNSEELGNSFSRMFEDFLAKGLKFDQSEIITAFMMELSALCKNSGMPHDEFCRSVELVLSLLPKWRTLNED